MSKKNQFVYLSGRREFKDINKTKRKPIIINLIKQIINFSFKYFFK